MSFGNPGWMGVVCVYSDGAGRCTVEYANWDCIRRNGFVGVFIHHFRLAGTL